MTHVRNIPHILEFGITHVNSENRNENYAPIGDSSIINTRNTFILDDGSFLGEYIPFYFGPRMPMLYVIQNGFNGVKCTHPKDIVYCVVSVQRVIDLNLFFRFTDGHAIDMMSMFFDVHSINRLDEIVDYDAVNAKYWTDPSDLDKKRRKEAEFLIKGDVSKNAIVGFIVYNEETKNVVRSYGVPDRKVIVKREYYF